MAGPNDYVLIHFDFFWSILEVEATNGIAWPSARRIITVWKRVSAMIVPLPCHTCIASLR